MTYAVGASRLNVPVDVGSTRGAPVVLGTVDVGRARLRATVRGALPTDAGKRRDAVGIGGASCTEAGRGRVWLPTKPASVATASKTPAQTIDARDPIRNARGSSVTHSVSSHPSGSCGAGGADRALLARGTVNENLHEDVQVTPFRTARNLPATLAAYSAPMRNIRAISAVIAAFGLAGTACKQEPAPAPAPTAAAPAAPPAPAAKPPLRIGLQRLAGLDRVRGRRSRRAGSRKRASTSSSPGSTTCRRWRPSPPARSTPS